jgi:hypothetical protein
MQKNDFGVFELNLPDNVRYVQRSLRGSLPRCLSALFSPRDCGTAVALYSS